MHCFILFLPTAPTHGVSAGYGDACGDGDVDLDVN
jgi:hypothetical protein